MSETIRPATEADLPDIFPIFAHARAEMAKNGNPTQWGTDRPTEALIRRQLSAGALYVLESDGKPHAVFAFIVGKDPTYEVIEGAWLSDTEYGTIHSLASDGVLHGVFERVLSYCEAILPHIRIDTHEDNAIMLHKIAKCGFTRCGIIYVDNGTPRIAFEKL